MFSQLKRLASRKSQNTRNTRRRSLLRSLEQLENRQLLAADLDFSTFFPSSPLEDGVGAIAQDKQGNVYVADYSYHPETFEIESAAISKLSPAGDLIWSQQTQEFAYEVAVDDAGLVYLISATLQDDLPVTADAAQSTRAGGYDFYAMILDGNAIDSDSANISTSELVFASYLGGSGDEDTTYLSLAVSPAGDLVLGGSTRSTDFPTTNQSSVDSIHSGGIDGIVASFKPTAAGYEKQLATYLGGSSTDFVRGIGVDDSGLIHVVGNTNSEVFPLTADAVQTERDGRVGFVIRMTSDGEILYSTFFGNETVQDAAIDASGNTYIVGTSAIEGFAITPGAYVPPSTSGSIGT
ncbi:MAG TPA: hypothetical protein DDW52_26095, partial [Planctomycetaceae bacterium]|nr:hypothetical protein [Planctomycetaceae bacterium]